MRYLFTILVMICVVLTCVSWGLYFERERHRVIARQYAQLLETQRDLTKTQARLVRVHERVNRACFGVANQLVVHLGLNKRGPIIKAIGGLEGAIK